jgi:hypothetical protein
VRTGSDRAGWFSFGAAEVGCAGQAGAGGALSRCQQVRKASAHGQSELMARVRWRAWAASFRREVPDPVAKGARVGVAEFGVVVTAEEAGPGGEVGVPPPQRSLRHVIG